MGITVNKVIDSIVVQEQLFFREELLNECKNKFKKLVDRGKIVGEFKENLWKANNEVKGRYLDFEFNDYDYYHHAGYNFGFSAGTMRNILKCYALCRYKSFILQTIGLKLNTIKLFLTRFGEDDLVFSTEGSCAVEDFLRFIDTPENQIEEIKSLYFIRRSNMPSGQRKLAPGINYEAIAYEIEEMYKGEIDDKLFIRFFPVYFWVKVTFIFPLRATEMLVTPLDCLSSDENGTTFLLLRRSKLKNHKMIVHHEVEMDYEYEKIPFPCPDVIKNIHKYVSLTNHKPRRFLFMYGNRSSGKMLSINMFNILLKTFVEERLIGNEKYSFVRYAAGIKEFEFVFAGDSRPIAISNIRFQGFSEDTCRQMAGHYSIDTTAGYASNVLDTIWASSIFRFQRRMKELRGLPDKGGSFNFNGLAIKPECTSPNKGKIVDCLKHGFIEDCFGCEYYPHAEEETDEHLARDRNKALGVLSEFLMCLSKVYEVNHSDDGLLRMFLEVQEVLSRYGLDCDEKVKDVFRRWEETQNTLKN